jgi:hypothetical protein
VARDLARRDGGVESAVLAAAAIVTDAGALVVGRAVHSKVCVTAALARQAAICVGCIAARTDNARVARDGGTREGAVTDLAHGDHRAAARHRPAVDIEARVLGRVVVGNGMRGAVTTLGPRQHAVAIDTAVGRRLLPATYAAAAAAAAAGTVLEGAIPHRLRATAKGDQEGEDGSAHGNVWCSRDRAECNPSRS